MSFKQLWGNLKGWQIGAIIGLIIGLISAYFLDIDSKNPGTMYSGLRTILYTGYLFITALFANIFPSIFEVSSINVRKFSTIFVYLTASLPWILVCSLCPYFWSKWKKTNKLRYLIYFLIILVPFIMGSLMGFIFLATFAGGGG